MANSPSAKKRIRQTARRTAVNHARKSRMRTFLRKVEEAVAGGDREAASTALRQAQPELARAASKGVIHRNAADRKMSRLSRRVKEMRPS
jgi:small subunit ribosomal protein S20